MTLLLSEEVKFNDTTGGTCVLDIYVPTCGGDTPPTNIVEVRVYISHYPSPKLDITTPRGTPNPG